MSEPAFFGFEATIGLITFVVVTAVLSYIMLGSGFFATQKSQEVRTCKLIIRSSSWGDGIIPLSVEVIGMDT